MYNSRRIEDLRGDVAANCAVWLDMCRAAGLDVLITGTVRDREYQEQCYRNGTSKTPTPSFHAQGIGLAFDFCKNVKGQEYADLDFFHRAGEIGEKIGFEWGGRWKSFPDRPHLQWSQGGKYTSAMIRSGKYPPAMPLYQREDTMTQKEFEAMYEKVNPLYTALGQVPEYWRGETAALMEAGALRGDGRNALHIRHEALGALVASARLKGGGV